MKSMEIQILSEKMNMDEVKELAKHWYGMMIKGCVDVETGRVAIGGDYHMESCELLCQNGSQPNNVWGFNIRFEEDPKGVLEFDSLVNIKPALENRSRALENAEIIAKAELMIKSVIQFYV